MKNNSTSDATKEVVLLKLIKVIEMKIRHTNKGK